MKEMLVGRVEDEALLTGRGDYAGDVEVDRLLHLRFVRSTVAHAHLLDIEVAEAAASPGVVAVFTPKDLGVEPVFVSATTSFIPEDFQPPAIAEVMVRYVGEIIAVVVADTDAHAADAAELVIVDYQAVEGVATIEDAVGPDAPMLFPGFGSNVAVDLRFEAGTKPCGDLVRVTLRNANNRMANAPMETNAVTVVPDPASGRITAWVSTQMPHGLRDNTAHVLGMNHDDLRFVAPAVGGSFGGKVPAEKEYALTVAAARAVGQPVRYVQSRAENLITMNGRGSISDVTLAATADGRLASMEVDLLVDGGAYPGVGVGLAITTRALTPSVYHVPRLEFRLRGVATNTAPVGAFRGAGRPEATALTERAMDVLAAELDLDPVELRRRNLIQPDEFPFETITGLIYDSGAYEACLDRALERAGYDALRAEQAARRQNGDRRALGIGVSLYVEISAGLPMFFDEYGSVTIEPSGRVEVVVGTSAHGQGHVTTYTRLVADTFDVAADAIDVVQGDTDLVPEGTGTGGSASGQMGANAVKIAADAVVDKGQRIAAHLLEARVDDIVSVPGGLAVQGVPASTMSWAELATAATDPDRLPAGMPPGLSAAPGFHQEGGTFPFGCHIAVVEVDVETGAVDLVRMIAVDDCGTILEPTIVEGQVHGGLAAGIGQALFECVQFDAESNPLTSTFADYAMPSAAEFPSFETDHTITPSPKNPLGVKGVGEAGTTGSTAAVHNAVVDAISHLGVRHLSLPLTPERIWRGIEEAHA